MKKTTIHQITSDYAQYDVVDMPYNGHFSRLLFVNNRSPQSGIALDEPERPLFLYNQRFLELAIDLRPSSILIIGGGAFTLPLTLQQHLPNTQIDVVEIDSTLLTIAHDHFQLPKDSGTITPIIADGAEYIKTCRKQYDLIIVDAFLDYDIPTELLSAAFNDYARILTKQGVLAINIISRYYTQRPTLAKTLVASAMDTFTHVQLYQADPAIPKIQDQNLLFVVSKTVDPPEFNYLQATNMLS